MAFKMNGSPAKMGRISGTAGHSSALKMKAQELASPTKQVLRSDKNKPVDYKNMGKDIVSEFLPKSKKAKKPYVKKGGKATGSMKDYAIGSKERYDEYEARGWAHDDTTKGYKPTTKTKPTKTEKVVAKGETKKAKIIAKAAKKTSEVTENVDKKTAKISKKEAKKTHGKGSKEHLEAKKKHLEAKEADRQGKKGGKKQGFFRKLASKINKKKQAKIDKKLAE